MAKFKYEGRDRNGKTTGKITSTSKRDAMVKLKEKGIRVIKIEEIPETLLTKDITIGNPVKLKDLVIYVRQFATLLKAGVSVVDSTSILAKQTESKVLSKALLDIEEDLRSGNPLSQRQPSIKRSFRRCLSIWLKLVK